MTTDPTSPGRGFPLVLDLAGRLVVVVGHGPVGARRTRAALAAGARVRVIDPAPRQPLPPDHAQLSAISESYRPYHLLGAVLAFACGPQQVNAQVVADARERGILVNSASDPATSDFLVPSVVRRGDLLLTVSTGGTAPALARRIRERLEAEFDTAFADWLRILAEIRPQVLAAVPDPSRRREWFEVITDLAWLERLRREGLDAVRAALLARLAQAAQSP